MSDNRTVSHEVEPKKSSMKWIGVGILIGIIIIASITVAYIIIPFINRPKPDIILLDSHDGFQGLNYVVYVDVGVKNNGGDGWVTIYAELRGGGRYEEKNQKIYMASGETKQLQFVFDVSLWSSLFSSMTYRAWCS